ncbi:MAG: endonuclease III [Patescibacteria group bacterium]|nr:endonuclease III [Patescibacteria group bacterium]
MINKGELKKRKERAKIVVKELRKLFPRAKTALKHSNALELLIAVMLSARCTDKKVNEVTEKLFKKYKHLEDYCEAKQGEFEKDIKSTGFYRNKTKNVLATAQMINEKFDGKVPELMEDLIVLPGVARKTASIVLWTWYGKNEGVAVDTHVKRISFLCHLTKEKNPDKIEQDLMDVIPREGWGDFNYRMVEYGREYCPAHKHDHENCPLEKALRKGGLS